MIPNRVAYIRVTRQEALDVINSVAAAEALPLIAFDSRSKPVHHPPKRWYVCAPIQDSEEIGGVMLLCGGGPRAAVPEALDLPYVEYMRFGEVTVVLPRVAAGVYLPGRVQARDGFHDRQPGKPPVPVKLPSVSRLFRNVVARLRRLQTADVHCRSSNRAIAQDLSGRASLGVAAYISESSPFYQASIRGEGGWVVEVVNDGQWALGPLEWPDPDKVH